MTDQVQFTITPDLLAVLGTISGKPLSPVSPLRYGTATDTAAGTGQLAALGICNADGTVAADKKAAVSTLAQAEGFTRIYLTTPSRVIEYIAYFGPDGTVAGVTNDGGMQVVTFPAPNDAMLELIRQTIGFSRFRSAPFAARLSPAETLVFSAIVDLQRREMLRKFADGNPAGRLAVSGNEILAMLKTRPGTIQWLSGAFVDLLSQKRIPKPAAVDGIVASLASKGLVTTSGEGCLLADEGVLLARTHLIPSMYLTLTTGKGQPSGKTNVTGFSCIISGVHDLLSIDHHADEVELESVSSAFVAEYAKTFLNDRAVLSALDTESPGAPAGGNERRFCPQCGGTVRPGLKFCSSCGAKIS